MGGLSPIHWLLVALVVLVLFGGRGKLSGLMGDAGKGIRAFRDGLKEAGSGTAPASDTPAAKVESSKDEAKG
jgi:sec-independent protein translocase protein TatA